MLFRDITKVQLPLNVYITYELWQNYQGANFRSEFDYIVIKASIQGKEISREKVVKKRAQAEEGPPDIPAFEDQTLCETCGSGDRVSKSWSSC